MRNSKCVQNFTWIQIAFLSSWALAQTVPTGYTAFYQENFDNRDISWFDHGKNGYWQFYWDVNNDPRLSMRRARYQLHAGTTGKHLRINRYTEDKDYTNSGLNPRCELRFENASWKFKKGEEGVIRLRTRHHSDQGNATFLQVMHRLDQGGAYPIVQMEALGTKYTVRGGFIPRKDLSSGASITADVMKWIQWEIRFRGNNASNGYVKIYKDGVEVFSQSGSNSSTKSDAIWIQVGLYGSSNMTKTVEFDDIVFGRKTGATQDPEPPILVPIAYRLLPAKIEAESYYAMSGVTLESTTDAGGGQNVGYLDAGDWMDYGVEVPSAGQWVVQLRVAAMGDSARLSLRDSVQKELVSIQVPATNGWQAFVTLSDTLSLKAGKQRIRFAIVTGGFNINWMQFEKLENPSTIQIDRAKARKWSDPIVSKKFNLLGQYQ